MDNFTPDWERLLDLLDVRQDGTPVYFHDVKKWMERAQAKCIYLANVLSGEEEAARCLNNVLSVLIVGVTLISWLLLCELTTTTVLIVIATPLLAASFIFGDTCKTLFQGLMFIYVVHPFNVGDQCIIDGKQLEVKRKGVWSCIFSDVHSPFRDQHIVYPNTELAAKTFVKCKTEIEWNDYIEFSFGFVDSDTIPVIKENIESYLSTNGFSTTLGSVDFLDKGDDYKIALKVKYKAPVDQDVSYYEFVKEKERQRFKLSMDIRSLLKKLELRYEKLREQEIDQDDNK